MNDAPQRLHRPYARLKREELSVTEVLECLPKPGMSFAAAKETALYAAFHTDWQKLSMDEAVKNLTRHHSGVWDGRAAMGTLIHAVNERYFDGSGVDLGYEITQLMETESKARTWKARDPQSVFDDAVGYVLGLEKWWNDYRPNGLWAEGVVREPGICIGQFDMLAFVDGAWPSDGFMGEQSTLIDFKTTAQQNPDKGIYMDSWSLQLNAYAHCSEQVFFGTIEDTKGREHIEEFGKADWDRPERAAVVHLRGDGDYEFFEIPLLESTWEKFKGLVSVARYVKEQAKVRPFTIERIL
jgi:hypothetical protein